MKDRVVLAYSGGLDTTVAISWIAKERNAEVVAVSIDLVGWRRYGNRSPARTGCWCCRICSG